MNLHSTNINIKSPYGLMSYIINYYDTNSYIFNKDLIITQLNKNNIQFKIDNLDTYNLINTNSKNIPSLKKYDLFFELDDSTNENNKNKINEYHIPNNILCSDIFLKFPQFAVDTYIPGIKYALTMNLYINKMNIYLGSYLINRNDSLALAPIERHNDNNYTEYIKVPIINPYNMVYGPEWKEFREKICGINNDFNNLGSILNITLYPVIENYSNNKLIYLSKELYTGSQNAINIYKLTFTQNFELKLNYDDENPSYICNIKFNETYKTLKEYYKKIYNIDINNLSAELIILDDNDVYKQIKKEIDLSLNQIIFQKYKKYSKNENMDDKLCFNNWDIWKEGIYVYMILTIKGSNHFENWVYSNKIPFVAEQMKYFIDNESIDKIDLNKDNLKDMVILNINAVNKILNNIIQMDNITNNKAGIIQPIFYKVLDLNGIILHKESNEVISINLNSIKYKTQGIFVFTIGKDQKIRFPEIGRNSSGILFKIIGNKLPEDEVGTYTIYTLDILGNSIEVVHGEYIAIK